MRRPPGRLTLRFILVAAAAGLAFELVAFSDFDGARADDLDLLVVEGGAGSSTAIPPPNVLFVFDTSVTMNNLLCANLDGDDRCESSTLRAKRAPNGATICESPALSAAVDAAGNPYAPLYPYTSVDPVFDGLAVYQQPAADAAFEEVTTSPLAACEAFEADCAKHQRCVYSMAALGYFWEPASSTCAEGLLTEECSSRKASRPPKLTSERPLVLGNFLNFYPPKGIGLKRAFTEAVSNLTGDVRLGVRELDGGGHDIKPPCPQARGPECFDGDPATECFSPSNQQMKNYIDALAFDDETKPLAGALDAAGSYFSRSNGQNTAICDYSQSTTCSTNNFIVLVSDGLPSGDADTWSALPFVSEEAPNWPTNDNGSLLEEVTAALLTIDHRDDIDDAQQVSTYTVSYGLTDPEKPDECAGLLDLAAHAGDGRCLPARNVAELTKALREIVSEIIARSRGFTAPAVPATRFSGTSTLTSAIFRPSDEFPLWQGHIYGFRVCDEKLGRLTDSECECRPISNADQVCIQDALGNEVLYDEEGYLASKPLWDAQLCLSGNVAGTSYSPAPAPDPFNLDVSACYRSAAERVIKTAAAATATDALDAADVVDFTAANATAGSPLLRALDVANDPAAGAKVIGFYRGVDAYDADADGNTGEDRNLNTIRKADGELEEGWWKLGDIFHSIPNVVEHPDGRGLGSWAKTESYERFIEENDERPRVILVGANDGMLHAFHAGTWDAGANGGKGGYDEGTGEELWAFVSPEMLPRLKNASTSGYAVREHPFMVDGSVMVRDIWAGDDAAAKDKAESYVDWHTIAVFGHRDGGSTYVALDVTDIGEPKLLWQFPPPGSDEAAEMARSWLDTYPAPAAIGPLREQRGSETVDRWVVLLSGGFDPTDRKGRMLLMLDAYTGAVLWKADRTTNSHLRYSFPATPSFYTVSGDNDRPFIAGIVAADHGGQLWHVPTPAQALSGDRFGFTPERFFVAGPSDVDPREPGNDATVEASEYQRWPFFFTPTLTRNGSAVRVIIGTGDRDQLIPHDDTDGIGGSTGYVCTDQQRLYAVDIGSCDSSPCREDDLAPITVSGDSSTWAPAGSRGWYYVLEAGEKVATPFQIYRGYAMYSTFLPTLGCGADAATCSAEAKGVARMYTRHYLSGKPLDWNEDGSISGETYVELGEGVPTAPSVSVGVSAAGATPTIFAGGSDSGLVSRSAEGLGTDLAQEIMRFYVSPDLHGVLHQ